ncbi:hypothetical protein J9303_09755 [Bacillaceae bacterium Marseille-Q3522]|nr:hypothetical protein [Bacillaceae bacterium Marseille-Q3522]
MNQNQHERRREQRPQRPMSFSAMVTLTGFIAGIIWGAVAVLASIFSFTEISPTVILDPWTVGEWKKGWLGILLSLFILGLLSIGVAFLYFFLLRRFKSMWVGVCYGIVLFCIVFLVICPLLFQTPSLTELSRDTIYTLLCLSVLYGVFIGFSISYEQTELTNQYQQKKDSQQNQ